MMMNDSVKEMSPKWKTPEEVMKFHRLKRKLNSRIITKEKTAPFTFTSNSINNEDSLMEFPVAKRRAPFFLSQPSLKRHDDSTDESGLEADVSSHSSEPSSFSSIRHPPLHSHNCPTSFKNVIKRLEADEGLSNSIIVKKIPVDWSLKSKIRFMSTKPFLWSANLRSSEEVSAVTGFVRCLEPGSGSRTGVGNLDTSPNAQFHQSCLYWQHPHLPWLPLFSRTAAKLSPVMVAAQLQMADSLHSEWTTAFKSLLQLVRMKQCPFFYILGTQFNCLFRAAGVAGMPEINALISPTTRGFRKMLEDEDISYTMPLKKKNRVPDSNGATPVDPISYYDDDDDMEDLMESAQVRKLTTAQKASDRLKESRLDGSDDSLVVVMGVDVQALFNLLVNCKNNHDRLPATLISPTAFQLATLKSCQVRGSQVLVDGAQLHSIQVEGPVMPHALYQMCLLLREAEGECSAALATVKQTVGFTHVGREGVPPSENNDTPSLFFVKENLSDCGLSGTVLGRLCESDPTEFGVIDSIEPDQFL